jgi:hypothetical protein
MAESRDQMPAAAGRGRLRASHADRERVVGALKTAFVQGRLAKDEFDLRVGQALASRTCAELAALTADLPAGPAAAPPPPPAWAAGEPRIPRAGLVLTVATVVSVAAWPVAFALPNNDDGAAGALIVTASLFYVLVLLLIGTPILADWLNERCARRQPRGPGPGAGGQAPPRMPPSDPGGQVPTTGHGHRHTAEATRRRRLGLPLPGSRSLRRQAAHVAAGDRALDLA